ncbi:MAG TPA: hypothetical protein VFI44_02865, partial [Ornithinibacter sp.]|nr:hypothetical protein [Ornithinibacter sp.]
VVAAVTYGATTFELVGPVEPAESGPLTARLARALRLSARGFRLRAGRQLEPRHGPAVPGTAVARVDDYVESLGLILLGLGLLGLVRLAWREPAWPSGLRLLTLALALGAVAAAATSLARSDAHDWVLLIVGLLVAPAWTAWLGAVLSRREPSPLRPWPTGSVEPRSFRRGRGRWRWSRW